LQKSAERTFEVAIEYVLNGIQFVTGIREEREGGGGKF
jgi:hypothetical protein